MTDFTDRISEISASLPSNSTGAITASALRQLLNHLANSSIGGKSVPGDDIVYLEDFAPDSVTPVADWTPILKAAVASFPTRIVNGQSYKGRILFTHRPGQASLRSLTSGYYRFTTPARTGGSFAIELNDAVTLEGIGPTGGSDDYGLSLLGFAAGLGGIGVYCQDTPVAGTTDAAGTYIKGLSLVNDDSSTGSSIGLYFNTSITTDRLLITQFSSHAVFTDADVTTHPHASSSTSHIANVDTAANGGDGYHTQGGDTNAIVFLNCRARGNRGWGFYDDSFLGCLWLGGQVASNHLGGVHANKSAASPAFIGVYAEFDQIHNISETSIVIGGFLAQAITEGANTSNGVAISGGKLTPGVTIRPQTSAAGGTFPSFTGGTLAQYQLELGNVGDDFSSNTIMALRDLAYASGSFPFRLRYGQGGFYWDYAATNFPFIRYIGSTATIANGFPRETTNIPLVGDAGAVVFDRGMFMGLDDHMIYMYVGSAAPTTGTFKQGDRVINNVATAGGNEGWVCVTGGTPGTWKAYGTIAA